MCNAYAERFVREVRETLDNMILFGDNSLNRALKAIEIHHNLHRPHQGIENRVPMHEEAFARRPVKAGDVECEESLGGLLKHYYMRKAA